MYRATRKAQAARQGIEMKNENLIIAVVVVSIIAGLVGSVFWTVSVWNECRETHSRMYCWNLISR